jgi:hypothetical protein
LIIASLLPIKVLVWVLSYPSPQAVANDAIAIKKTKIIVPLIRILTPPLFSKYTNKDISKI